MYKILITDDSRLARKMIIKFLKELLENKVEIIEATNGQESIDLYKLEKPHLCFMDLTMPIKDGFEATKEINEYDSKRKIMVLSADVQEGSMLKVKEYGAIGFVKKPIKKEELLKLLLKLGMV